MIRNNTIGQLCRNDRPWHFLFQLTSLAYQNLHNNFIIQPEDITTRVYFITKYFCIPCIFVHIYPNIRNLFHLAQSLWKKYRKKNVQSKQNTRNNNYISLKTLPPNIRTLILEEGKINSPGEKSERNHDTIDTFDYLWKKRWRKFDEMPRFHVISPRPTVFPKCRVIIFLCSWFPRIVSDERYIINLSGGSPFIARDLKRVWKKEKKSPSISPPLRAIAFASHRFCELKDHRRSFLDFLFDCNRLRTNEVKTGHEITDRSSKMQARDDKRNDEVMVQWKR